MKRTLIFLFIALLSMAGSSTADELYVKNRHVPEQHYVDGERFVELEPFATALDLELKKSGHGWLVGDEPENMPLLKPGQVWLAGSVLRSRLLKGAVSISLNEAVTALGAKLTTNPVLGTTDLYMPKE